MGQENLTSAQYDQLLKEINPARVSMLDNMAYLEAWDVRAHLIRVFGFGGFSIELLDYEMAYEQETTTRQGKAAFKVGYRARVQLTIPSLGATYTEAAFGESVMPDFKRGDAHDMALKTAESQAFKRAAMNLGTQFGLSLYRDGSTADVVGRTLAPAPSEGAAAPAAAAPAGKLADFIAKGAKLGFDEATLLKEASRVHGVASLAALSDQQIDDMSAALSARAKQKA